MIDFQFNELGVCLNPETITIEVGMLRTTLKVALSKDGEWAYGYEAHGCGQIYYLPCAIKQLRYRASTEVECIEIAARECAIFFCNLKGETGANIDNIDKMVRELKAAAKTKPIQLQLF